jgi:hypothetical protein
VIVLWVVAFLYDALWQLRLRRSNEKKSYFYSYENILIDKS